MIDIKQVEKIVIAVVIIAVISVLGYTVSLTQKGKKQETKKEQKTEKIEQSKELDPTVPFKGTNITPKESGVNAGTITKISGRSVTLDNGKTYELTENGKVQKKSDRSILTLGDLKVGQQVQILAGTTNNQALNILILN